MGVPNSPGEEEIWGLNPQPKHAITNCSQTISPMLLPGEYKRRVGWTCQQFCILPNYVGVGYYCYDYYCAAVLLTERIIGLAHLSIPYGHVTQKLKGVEKRKLVWKNPGVPVFSLIGQRSAFHGNTLWEVSSVPDHEAVQWKWRDRLDTAGWWPNRLSPSCQRGHRLYNTKSLRIAENNVPVRAECGLKRSMAVCISSVCGYRTWACCCSLPAQVWQQNVVVINRQSPWWVVIPSLQIVFTLLLKLQLGTGFLLPVSIPVGYQVFKCPKVHH